MHEQKTVWAIGLAGWVAIGVPIGVTLARDASPRFSVNPPVTGAPGGRSPGGSRSGDCLGAKPLVVVQPKNAMTTTPYPTFAVAVPPTLAKTAVFVLQDGSKQVYRSRLNLTPNTRVVTVKLPPQTSPGLAVGKPYRWVFSVLCDAQAVDRNPFVQGWVKRIQ